MSRILIGVVAASILANAGLIGVYRYQSAALATAREALKMASAYIETTKEVRNATSDLPNDPDAVLARLCAMVPGQPSCGDTGRGAEAQD